MNNNEKLDNIVHGSAGILSGLDTKGVYYEKPFPLEEYYEKLLNETKQLKRRQITVHTDLENLYTEFTGKDPWSYEYASTAHTEHYVEWLEDIIKAQCLTIIEPETLSSSNSLVSESSADNINVSKI